jgi:hypothetical protein
MGIVHVILIFGTCFQYSTFIYIYIYGLVGCSDEIVASFINKAPSKRGNEEQRENPSLSQKCKNPNGSQRAKEQIMFQSFH